MFEALISSLLSIPPTLDNYNQAFQNGEKLIQISKSTQLSSNRGDIRFPSPPDFLPNQSNKSKFLITCLVEFSKVDALICRIKSKGDIIQSMYSHLEYTFFSSSHKKFLHHIHNNSLENSSIFCDQLIFK
jgi:hypothetical protein